MFTLEGKSDFKCLEGHSGKGGLNKVIEILSQGEDKVMCGAFLVLAIDDRGTTVSDLCGFIRRLFMFLPRRPLGESTLDSHSLDRV